MQLNPFLTDDIEFVRKYFYHKVTEIIHRNGLLHCLFVSVSISSLSSISNYTVPMPQVRVIIKSVLLFYFLDPSIRGTLFSSVCFSYINDLLNIDISGLYFPPASVNWVLLACKVSSINYNTQQKTVKFQHLQVNGTKINVHM